MWYQAPIQLGVILVLLSIGTVAALGMSIDWETKRAVVAQAPIMSAARVIPQLFDANGTRVSASSVRVNEDSDFRLAYCKEYLNDGLGELKALIQLDVAPGGLPEHWIEMRFEDPMIESTMHEAALLRRCPHPSCGYDDYMEGIGVGGEFYDANAVFLTTSQVTVDRNTELPFPISCGCSIENPPRFSCTMATAELHKSELKDIFGGIAIVLHFTYPATTDQ